MKPIKIKASRKGLLHKELGVKPGTKIPQAKIRAAAKTAGPAMKKRLVFAENFGHPGSAPLPKAHTSKDN